MTKKRTALAQLQDKITQLRKIENSPYTKGVMLGIIDIIKELKPTEKQQIIDACTSRCTFSICDLKDRKDCNCGKNYYNETFND